MSCLRADSPSGRFRENCPLEEAARQLREQQAGGPQPIRELERPGRPAAGPAGRKLPGLRAGAASRDRGAVGCRVSSGTFPGPPRPPLGRQSSRAGCSAWARHCCRSAWRRSSFLRSARPTASANSNSGLARIEQGEYAAAVDYLNNSIRANPDSSEALFARGRAYQRLGRVSDRVSGLQFG